MKFLLYSLLLFPGILVGEDSLEVQFSIVGMNFYADHNVIKIRVPAWLKSSELIPQIKRSVVWPGEPPPAKLTYIYVFKETDQIGEKSKTGATYIPGKGFRWSLSDWQPAEIPEGIPTERDLGIYNHFIETILTEGSSLDNQDAKKKVARLHNISIAELDSIYSWVKYWLAKKQREQSRGDK